MEVMRITLKRDWHGRWNSPMDEVEIDSPALHKHFAIPMESGSVDVVIDTRPSKGRLDAKVAKDKDGVYLNVEAMSCGADNWDWWGFPGVDSPVLDKLFARMLKRHRFGVGRRLYVGIEY